MSRQDGEPLPDEQDETEGWLKGLNGEMPGVPPKITEEYKQPVLAAVQHLLFFYLLIPFQIMETFEPSSLTFSRNIFIIYI